MTSKYFGWAVSARRIGLVLLLAVLGAGIAAACSSSDDGGGRGNTIKAVVDRGELNCGVKQTQALFGLRTGAGDPEGFDIEFCKAIAAAVLGDAGAVNYVDASDASTRFNLLADEEIDVLIRTTTLTSSRDAKLSVDFAQTTFYTGQGFAVHADSNYGSTQDMSDNPTICVQTGTTTEQNLSDRFLELGYDFTPLGGTDAETLDAFTSRRCDVWTADQSNLASSISNLSNPQDFRILGELISKEPLGPGVRDYDSDWKDVVNWVVYGLIAAEEAGITSRNVGALASNPTNPEVARLLGVSYQGGEVADHGLGWDKEDGDYHIDPQFIQRAVQAVGNYGEIYDRTVGDAVPRACTLNALWSEDKSNCPPGTGGILYAIPYR